jgi:hypothetical protein
MNGPQADLWRVPSGGGSAELLFRWPARVYSLSWDSLGRGLYLASDVGVSHNDIWYRPLSSTDGAPQHLTSGQADEDWPSVDSAGEVLVHSDNQERATALVRRDLATGETRTLAIDRVDFGEPTGTVRLGVADAETGVPTVGRVSLRRQGGKFVAPLGALYRITATLGHFYCREEASLEVPAGRYEVVASRGPEYLEYQGTLEVNAGANVHRILELQRWTNMAAAGWYSGENHIHANYGYGAWFNTPASTLDMCEGEDLNVANVMVANSDGDGVYDREFFRGASDPQSRPGYLLWWNEEFRSTLWGHLTLVNLERLVEPLFTGFLGTTNPWDVPTNADIAERARRQQASVSYTHPASNPASPYDGAYSAKGLPVDVALGRVDTLDVMGFGYAATLDVWYRLLNCGVRLPAAAGTDCFLNRISSSPPGWGRAYVNLTNGLSYRDWVDAQRAGRSFVAKGILIEFSANGRGMGEALALEAPGVIQVIASASSAFPIEALELVQNGKVVAAARTNGKQRVVTLNESVRCESAGWLAVRARGPAAGSAGSRFDIARALFAHSNPVFVELKERPYDASADARFFLDWMDRLEKDLRRRDRVPGDLDRVLGQLNVARAFYGARLNRSKP